MATAIEKAAKVLGSQAALGRVLNISRAAVCRWKKEAIPAEHCPAIEQATGGQVRCEELRPDIPWGVLRGTLTQKEGGNS
jgi:DNA-binding transcriptional regulator YdaS (Cro superfamily)